MQLTPCREDPDKWFPADTDLDGLAAAQLGCWSCPVRAECAALGAEEEYGVWGGTTPADRGFRRARNIAPEEKRAGQADLLAGKTDQSVASARHVSTFTVRKWRRELEGAGALGRPKRGRPTSNLSTIGVQMAREGIAHDEIAKALDVQVGTVARWLSVDRKSCEMACPEPLGDTA